MFTLFVIPFYRQWACLKEESRSKTGGVVAHHEPQLSWLARCHREFKRTHRRRAVITDCIAKGRGNKGPAGELITQLNPFTMRISYI